MSRVLFLPDGFNFSSRLLEGRERRREECDKED
jgi:hypothetical protein